MSSLNSVNVKARGTQAEHLRIHNIIQSFHQTEDASLTLWALFYQLWIAVYSTLTELLHCSSHILLTYPIAPKCPRTLDGFVTREGETTIPAVQRKNRTKVQVDWKKNIGKLFWYDIQLGTHRMHDRKSVVHFTGSDSIVGNKKVSFQWWCLWATSSFHKNILKITI